MAIPSSPDPDGWMDYERHDTLKNMLEGCMFFRKEPAMEAELMELTVEPAGQTIEFGPAEPENVQPDPPPPIGKKPKKTVDVGKLIALHNAGWPVAKIADELGVSTRTVYNYLPSKD